MLGPTQIERLDAVIMFSWNIIVNVLVVGLIYIPVDLGDSYSPKQLFLCNTCHQRVSQLSAASFL